MSERRSLAVAVIDPLTATSAAGESGEQLRGVLHTLPRLSNEQLTLVYEVLRREVQQRNDASGRQRVGWALARDAW